MDIWPAKRYKSVTLGRWRVVFQNSAGRPGHGNCAPHGRRPGHGRFDCAGSGLAVDVDAMVSGVGIHRAAALFAGGRMGGSRSSIFYRGNYPRLQAHAQRRGKPDRLVGGAAVYAGPRGGAAFLLACAWYAKRKGNSNGA
jgi:hypothetical protein